MPRNQTAFAEWVTSRSVPREKFEPHLHYNPDGDCIEFLAKETNFKGRRIDSLVTVFLDQETQEIVGAQVKGIQQMRKMPAWRISVNKQDGTLKLNYLFVTVSNLAKDGDEQMRITSYRKLVEMGEQTAVKMPQELLDPAG